MSAMKCIPILVAMTLQGDWPLYEQPADGFALAVPPGWTVLKLEPGTLDETLKQGIRANPDLKAMEQGIRQQVAAGVRFLATETASGGPNVNVLKTPVRGKPSLDAAAAEFVKGFEALPSVKRPIARRRVELRPGEAERLDFVLPVKLPGGGSDRLAMTAYLLVRGQQLYVVTLTSNVGEAAKYKATFERIAQSFRFLGK